jgi:hypothetical protein
LLPLERLGSRHKRRTGRPCFGILPACITIAAVTADMFLLGFAGCTRTQPPAPEEDDSPGTLRISWVRPNGGEILSDTVRCELRIAGGRARAVSLFADDSLVVGRSVEPWTFGWLPPDTSADSGAAVRTIRLRAGAIDAAGNESIGPALEIRWFPNGAPRLRFVGLTSPAWFERVAGESLRVEAIDPEEGPLRGGAIEWRSDREGLIGFGERIPVESLVMGSHLIRVRATDRWLRTTSAYATVEAFDYSSGSTPEGLLDDLRHALLDRRADIYAERLDEGFSFIFCPAERQSDANAPVRWDREQEAYFVRRCLADPAARFVKVDWTIASIQEARIAGEVGMKAEIAGIGIKLAGAAEETLVVSGGSARAYLRAGSDSEGWRLVQWRDLGAGKDLTQGRLRLDVMSRALRPAHRAVAAGSPRGRRPRNGPDGRDGVRIREPAPR